MKMICECIVGSRAYGLNRDGSDTDIKGVYIQPLNDVLGFRYKEHQVVCADTTYYEVRKFIELLGKANPTILEMLWIPNDLVIEYGPAFDEIKKYRQEFLTKACQHSYLGYAVHQLKRFHAHVNYKNLMHTCRLCIAAKHIAEHGFMQVFIEDSSVRNFLLNIRDQKIQVDEVIKWAENEISQIKTLFQKSSLPENIDINIMHDLLVTIRNKYSPTLE